LRIVLGLHGTSVDARNMFTAGWSDVASSLALYADLTALAALDVIDPPAGVPFRPEDSVAAEEIGSWVERVKRTLGVAPVGPAGAALTTRGELCRALFVMVGGV
jgi:hypothetical protein